MYVHFEAVRQLLAYNAAVEAGEEVAFQELSEWIEDLKYGAYQECIDLYQAISDQYKGDENRQGYPYSAVQQRRGFSDIYKGAPPVVHLILCQDAAVLAEDMTNFLFDEDYPALERALKTFDRAFLEAAVSRDGGWDFALVQPEPEPAQEPEPEPKPKPKAKPTPKPKPKPPPPTEPKPKQKPVTVPKTPTSIPWPWVAVTASSLAVVAGTWWYKNRME